MLHFGACDRAGEVEALLRRCAAVRPDPDAAWHTLAALVHALLEAHARFPMQCTPAALRHPTDVFQYWDQARPPADVAACLASWDRAGIPVHRYDLAEADAFLHASYGGDVLAAFRHAHHPAMQADLFRLARLYRLGGLYVDADDAFVGDGGLPGFRAGVAVLPLSICMSCRRSVPFERPFEGRGWFYLGNAPMFGEAGHPLLARALDRAVGAVLARRAKGELANIHDDTGPGAFSMSALDYAVDCATAGQPVDLSASLHWPFLQQSLPLRYKDGERNWRSNAVIYSADRACAAA